MKKRLVLWIIAIVIFVTLMIIGSIKSWNDCIKNNTETYCRDISR